MPRTLRTHMKGRQLGICAKCQKRAPERSSECGECCKARHRAKAQARYWSTPPKIVWQPFESSVDFALWVIKSQFPAGTKISTTVKESGKWLLVTANVAVKNAISLDFMKRHEYQRSRLA